MRPMGSLRVITSIAVYLAVVVVVIYGVLDPRWDDAFPVVHVVLGVLHFGLGVVLARWWALLLPVAPFLLALPAGYPQSDFEPLPVAALFFFGLPIEVGCVVAGIGVARLAARRDGQPGERASRQGSA